MMEERAEEIRKEVRQQVINSVDYSREISDEEIFELIDKDLLEKARSNILSLNDRKRLRMQIFHSIRKLDILQQLVDDQSVTEIMINGTNNIFIEKDGAISRFDAAFESKEKLEDVVQQIVAGCNRVVNESSPIVDARLSNGARVNVVLSPVALNGPIITIRRFPENPINPDTEYV